MNDLCMTLLWLRAMEIAIGHTLDLVRSELELPMFQIYRPWVRA